MSNARNLATNLVVETSVETDFDFYDRLPPELRQKLQDSALDYAAADFYQIWQEEGLSAALGGWQAEEAYVTAYTPYENLDSVDPPLLEETVDQARRFTKKVRRLH